MKLADLSRAPADAGPALVSRLVSISKSVRQLASLKLAECGVAPGQDQLLLCFAPGEAVSVAAIAERLSVRASTVSKMVDILERKGWVGREADDADARRVLVRLTPAGAAVRDAVRVIEAALEIELHSVLGEDEAMLPCLEKLDRVLAQRLRRLR